MLNRIDALFITGLAIAGLAACDVSINEDIVVPDGATATSGARTVNGDVVIGRNAVVEDGQLATVNGNIRVKAGAKVNDCTTVNGNVTVAEAATTGRLESINGNLKIAREVHVRGDIKLTNGEADLKEGSVVDGNLATIHGGIQMTGATVTGDVTNYSGGMQIMDGSVIKGGLTVRKPKGYDSNKTPVIIIGRDSEVHGAMVFERRVKLYVHHSAKVAAIDGAEPVAFTGDAPDQG